MTSRRATGLTGNAPWLVLGLLAVLAAAEVGLRLAGFGPPGATDAGTDTGYFIRAPDSRTVFYPSPRYLPGVAGAGAFTTNHQGLRGRDVGPDEYRILAVGGAPTECLYLDDREAWPALLESALGTTADGRRAWVGNAGVAGTGSRDHVVLLTELLDRIPPVDEILLLAGMNDMQVALQSGDRRAAPAPLPDRDEWTMRVHRNFTIAPGWDQSHAADDLAYRQHPWLGRLALYRAFRAARAEVRAALLERGLTTREDGEVFARLRERRRAAKVVLDAAPDLRAALADYRANLESIADLAAARSIRLVLMTQPALWREDMSPAEQRLLWLGGLGNFEQEQVEAYYSAAVLRSSLAAFNAVTLDVCRTRRLECIDLDSALRHEPGAFYDDAHFTESGSRAVARFVANFIGSTPPFRTAEAAASPPGDPAPIASTERVR